MNLTPRQMLILVALIVGFGVAAFVVSRSDGDAPKIDQALWCDRAGGLEGTGEVFGGGADDVTAERLEEIKLALFDVETIAPYGLRPQIGVLADFTLITQQELRDLAWPEAFAAARENKEADIDAAIAQLEIELSTCGLSLG